MFKYDYTKDGEAPPFDENAKQQEPLFTMEYLHGRKDVHFERGVQCVDCHTNPRYIGYGTGNSRNAAKLLGDAPLFQDLSAGVYGDIPDAKNGRWQTPEIKDFPYSSDQLIARSGIQVYNECVPAGWPPSHQ